MATEQIYVICYNQTHLSQTTTYSYQSPNLEQQLLELTHQIMIQENQQKLKLTSEHQDVNGHISIVLNMDGFKHQVNILGMTML